MIGNNGDNFSEGYKLVRVPSTGNMLKVGKHEMRAHYNSNIDGVGRLRSSFSQRFSLKY